MAEELVQRRLAAILAADVVGYSKLMGEDEAGTLAAVTSHISEVFEPEITAQHGRIFKTMGDAVFAEFTSVVDAVRCAVAVQEVMQERNGEIPEDRRVEFRIGVNLGDVIIQDDDVFGEGVNVAARLEGLAEPGGICVSSSVHEQVRNKVDAHFDDLGPQQVKNIAESVRAFRINISASPKPEKSERPPLPDKPSIAVLPFENMSSDPEQEYFSDGISEDIITDLSKISGLLVIARNSTFVYKGRHVSLREVGRELGVRFVLEGSVRKAGTRVRITAQLIDTLDESHVWADRYDASLDDIFTLQDRVTTEIVDALELRLRAPDPGTSASQSVRNTEAYDHLLRARQYYFRFTREANAAARVEIEKALTIDPDFAEALTMLADCHLQSFNQVWSSDPKSELESAAEQARRAVAANDQLALAHAALASANLWQRFNDVAIEGIDRAIELSPNDQRVIGLRAMIRVWSGLAEQAKADAKEALRLDPNNRALPLWYLGMAQYHTGSYEDAGRNLRESALLNPDFMPVHLWMAANEAHLGKTDAAARAIATLRGINPAMSLRLTAEIVPFSDDAMRTDFIEDLRTAGIPA